MTSTEFNKKPIKNRISKELRIKANDFLNNKVKDDNLVELIQYLEKCLQENLPLTPILLTLEVVFVELLKRKDMIPCPLDEQQAENAGDLTKYKEWLNERYAEAWTLMLKGISSLKSSDSSQSLISCMKILAAEGKNPIDNKEPLHFPRKRLRNIMDCIIDDKKSQHSVIQSLKEFAQYADVVQNCWNILSIMVKKTSCKNEIWALNFLDFANVIALNKSVQDEGKMLIPLSHKAPGTELFHYDTTRKFINRVWNNVMLWINQDVSETVHKRILIVLLENVLPHYDKPVQLTDFLMDSLDCGGAVSLLALQGVFTLIQKHNITYPNIYEKLYSMFEPEIFHTKFKARLFYLADIFLSSTHLPENLVSAFVKRLARLSLISPPQDALIILQFIGNLLLRHVGLKRLISATVTQEVSHDPFIMDEREPTKSNAMDSSLWEIVALQKHAIPSVATSARFISQPLPNHEWNLSAILEIKEDDIFDQEISKKHKQYALAFERPQNLFLPKNDKFQEHWCLV